jgi:uridine phosphorylase
VSVNPQNLESDLKLEQIGASDIVRSGCGAIVLEIAHEPLLVRSEAQASDGKSVPVMYLKSFTALASRLSWLCKLHSNSALGDLID